MRFGHQDGVYPYGGGIRALALILSRSGVIEAPHFPKQFRLRSLYPYGAIGGMAYLISVVAP